MICVADGQKIAKRISSQINKESRKIKKLVNEYNSDSPPAEISMQTALNPDETAIDFGSKCRNDLVHAYLRKIRSCEEIALLKEEIQNAREYICEKKRSIRSMCETLSTCDDVFSRGACNLLTHLHWRLEQHAHQFETISDSDIDTDAASDESETEL